MHIAAAAPIAVRPEEVSPEFLAKEKEILLAQMQNDPKMAGKPQQVLEKVLEGKVQKIFEEQCLLNQKFVKNPDLTVSQFVSQTVAAIGENISIPRFTRYVLGETAKKDSQELN